MDYIASKLRERAINKGSTNSTKQRFLLVLQNEGSYKSLGDKIKVQNAFTVSQILMSVKEIIPVT